MPQRSMAACSATSGSNAMTDQPANRRGLEELAEGYDAFILDLWGVLHDGLKAYPEAVEAMQALKARGKRLLLLSNAPRRTEDLARQMANLGLSQDSYHHLMSSGQDAWTHLRDRPCDWYRDLGRRMLHIGPPHDANMRDGLDVSLVHDVQFAEFVLNTGPALQSTEIGSLEPVLRQAADRELPMICANPDIRVMRGEAVELCAGALAKRYEELDGEVRYHGKPYQGIYDSCFRLLGDPDPARTLAVGDTLHTDIAGARQAGLDSAFVPGGIHASELGVRMGDLPDPGTLTALFGREGEHPTHVIPAFRW
ncbi:TIGR01459 family HAD-type hydrolase [Rhodovibrio sodomensis]|uniref:TIGR01459 family HAD-type hydrolase n=2 Tax=Rhodovibrio sodomensis TaxID=1088 RepID=A0ABS1DCC7_9PROT|nr:TIGR01459 family HAD-type hydrolase [Rhodovibrio sodomensis]